MWFCKIYSNMYVNNPDNCLFKRILNILYCNRGFQVPMIIKTFIKDYVQSPISTPSLP